jgi:hypothetical protein
MFPLIAAFSVVLFASTAVAATSAATQRQIAERESAGDLAAAKSMLEQEAARAGDGSAAAALAEFLDRHADPGKRDAFLKWASEETDASKQRLALRQAVLIDFMDGRKSELSDDLERYRSAGGSDLSLAARGQKSKTYSTVLIPGPLSSFARMAALSPDLHPEDLLPALARNVVTNGYEASGNEVLQQTEYLRLLIRYISQARELQAMANKDHKIVIPTCDSEETGNLLKILGYRMRGSCGADIVLETVNPTRAFLTVDSAFPLTDLERDLRANHRFELTYAPTSVPVLYNAEYWISALSRGTQGDFIDAFVSDPSLCRLYLGLSHLDKATAEAMRSRTQASKLRLYANVLDFYGSMFQIRNGAAVVPGSAKVWSSMVGASPSNPGAFFEKLLMTDDGWMASYFDALSRLDNGPTLAYLTQPERMKRLYDALRGKITSPGPARPVFRSSTDLMLLTTSLRIEPGGDPHIPGNLDVWRTLFVKHPHGKYDGKLTRAATSWRTSDDLVEALFGLSRKTADNEPLKIFLALNDVDRGRAKPMSAELAARLINDHRTYGAQYRLFAEAPVLSEASISHYLDLCAEVSSIHDPLLKGDAAGSAQALVELWSILTRQGSIPADVQDSSFAAIVDKFRRVKQEVEVFNAARAGVDTLLAAAQRTPTGSRQEQIVELLVGKLRTSDEQGQPSLAETFLRIYDAQRLISLDSLFLVADRLGKGTIDPKVAKNINDQLERIEETETLRGSLSREEKSSFAVGYWSDRHIEQERKLDLDALLKNTEKKDGRTILAPFLRDSLLGLLYCYYAPPGAQVLFTNPMFVRSHDFTGPEGAPSYWRQTELSGSGWPANGGGRLTGSLISLPYALAQAEQNFLTPRREQALIWSDLVPQMIMNVTVTRWRNVSPDQLHWVSLHIQRGRYLLAAAALDSTLESRVMESLGRLMTPAGVGRVEEYLETGDFTEACSQIPPSALYAIAADPRLRDASTDVASLEIQTLAGQKKPELAPQAIARVFGTAKPTLTHSYQPALLYLRTFPALMGYSSRILAETWESNNLYYAALADQAGIPADQLETYVPDWNRSAIENIFATHLEDWPALIRSLNVTADNVLHRNTQKVAVSNTTISQN